MKKKDYNCSLEGKCTKYHILYISNLGKLERLLSNAYLIISLVLDDILDNY